MIPDWGGRDATFEVAQLQAPTTLVLCSRRGNTNLSWAITAGGLVDLLTIAGLAAGLDERV